MMSCAEEGRGVHNIVMMCDVWGDRGETLHEVTHITSAARPGQGVVDDNASTLYRTPWYSTHGASDGE